MVNLLKINWPKKLLRVRQIAWNLDKKPRWALSSGKGQHVKKKTKFNTKWAEPTKIRAEQPCKKVRSNENTTF